MIRELTKKDIAIITDICTKGMEFDYFNECIVREKTIDAVDYESSLGLVYENEGCVVGFIQGVMGIRRDVPHGWVRLLVVNPAFRRKGIGSSLLIECENRLKKRDARKISIMDAVPNYLTPGVDYRYTEAFGFLEKHGYERARQGLNLICDVAPDMFNDEDRIKQLRQEGFDIKRAEKIDTELVLEFIRQEFASWEGEVRAAYRNDPVSMYICIHEGKVVGFSAYDTNNYNTGWFGPMGVLPVTRRKGIGAIVCRLCLHDIALQGHRKSIIPWVGPVRFYSRVCQSRIDRIFWIWEKSLQ